MKNHIHRIWLLPLLCLFCIVPAMAGDTVPLEFGVAMNDTISVGGEVDNFTFTGVAGDRVAGFVGSTQSFVTVKVFGPAGDLLASYGPYYAGPGDSNYHDPYFLLQLPTSGTYTAVVSSPDSTRTGAYGIMIQRTNNPENAKPMVYGENALGSYPFGYTSYTFDAEQGDPIYARLVVLSGSSYVDVRLYAPNGTPLVTPTSYLSPQELSATAPVSGTYVLTAGPSYQYKAPATYSLYLQRRASPQNAVALGFGQTVDASLGGLGEMDAYTFTGTAGDTVVGRTAATPVSSNEWVVQPILMVYDPAGTLIGTYKLAYMVRPDFLIRLPATGTYTVLVADNDGRNTGGYGVVVQRTNNPGNATDLAFGSTSTGSIGILGQLDAYTFAADQGDPFFARVSSSFGGGNGVTLRLYSPNGTLIQKQERQSPVDIFMTLPTAGRYTLLVGDSTGAYTGSYGLFIQRCADPQQSTPLGYGQVINGSISVKGDLDAYTFTGTAGDTVFGRAAGRPVTPTSTVAMQMQIQVYDPSGVALGTYWNPSTTYTPAEFLLNLTATGTYTMIVSEGKGANTGDYGVLLQCLNRPDHAENISYGNAVLRSIDQPAEFDTYTFSAEAGDPIFVKLASQFTFPPLYQWVDLAELRLYAPDGSLLNRVQSTRIPSGDSGYYTSNVTCELTAIAPVSGTYVILADEARGSYCGPYGMSLQRSKDPVGSVPLAFGLTVNATLAHIGDMDAFTFTGQAGDMVIGRVGGPAFSERVRLYGPSGSKLGQYEISGTFAEFEIRLPETGTYTLIVTDDDGWQFGEYWVTIQRTNNPGNAVDLTSGLSVEGTLVLPSDLDTFTFNATQWDILEARVNYPRSSYGVDPRIYGPNGTALDAPFKMNYYPPKFSILTAPETGTYTLILKHSTTRWDPVTYAVDVTNYPPEEMVLGQTYRGNVSSTVHIPWSYYYTDTPSGEDLVVQVVPDSSTVRLELYGALNRLPTTSSYDFVQREKTASGAYELLIPSTSNGTYYFGVFAADGTTDFSIRANAGDMYISNVYPRVVSNVPDARIQIYGLGFVQGMGVRLARNGTTVATAGSTFLASPAMLVATFDLSSAPLGVYDVEVIWPDQQTRSVPAALQVRSLPEGARYQEKDFSVPSGQTIHVPLHYVEGQNLFVTLQKHTWTGDVHYSWGSIMTLDRDGVVVANASGTQDMIIHIPNPPPGDYTISVSAPGQGGHAILTVWDQLPTLTAGEWIVERVLRPFGSVYHQIVIPPGQDTLQFEAQAMGFNSRFIVYNGQWKNGRAWISSTGPYASLTVPNPPSGLYVVEFTDTHMVTGTDQARDVMLRASTTGSTEPPPGYLPTIASISPTKGGNTGNVTIDVRGAWLNNWSSVSLVRSGYPDITATTVTEPRAGTELIATFDMTGREPGAWDLTVAKQDGQVVTAPFTIEAGGSADVQMDVIGRSMIRTERESTYVIRFTNNGNLDGLLPVVKTEACPEESSSLSMGGGGGSGGRVTGALMSVPAPDKKTIPPGTSVDQEIRYLNSDSSGGEAALEVSAHGSPKIYTPPSLATGIDAAFPAPGIPLTFNREFPATYTNYRGPLGYGWVHSYDLHLTRIDESTLTLQIGDQNATLFHATPEGTFVNASSDERLWINNDGTFTLRGDDAAEIGFNSAGLLSWMQDDNENRITFEYSSDKLTTIRHSNGKAIQIAYQKYGSPSSDFISAVTDPAGRTTTFQYSAARSRFESFYALSSVTYPDGTSVRYEYQALNPRVDYPLMAAVSGSGSPGVRGGMLMETPCNYDQFTLAKVGLPNGDQRVFNLSNETGRLIDSYTLGKDSQTYGATGADGSTSPNGRYNGQIISYDDQAGTTSFTNDLGATSSITLNNYGKVVAKREPSGAETSMRYDSEQRLTAWTDPMGKTVRFQYDENGELASFFDAKGNQIRYTYDSSADRVASIIDKRSNEYQFTYDGSGNLATIEFPDASAERYSHDQQGNTVQKTTRNGDTIRYSYNENGQLTKKEFPDGTSDTYAYDSAGNLITVVDAGGRTEMTYDLLNRRTSITYASGDSFRYNYDEKGRLSKRTNQDGRTLSYLYNPMDLLVRVIGLDGRPLVDYRYDTSGRLTETILPNGIRTTNEYDASDRVTKIVHTAGNGTISFFEYEYDTNGNIATTTTEEGRFAYRYDSMNQLIGATYPDGKVFEYSYDAAGNRVSVVANHQTEVYSTDALDRYQQVGNTTYRHDSNGNLIEKNENGVVTRYSYDAENNLVSIAAPGDTWEYRYDAFGFRNSETHNGETKRFVYDHSGLGNIVAEYWANGTLAASYDYGIGLISQTSGSGEHNYYVFDNRGSTTEIVSANQTIRNKYRYDPFGNYQLKQETVSNPFTYVGQYGAVSAPADLFYMRMRYYDPGVGRFLTRDPSTIPSGHTNEYIYCHNNPIVFIDPSGLFQTKPFILGSSRAASGLVTAGGGALLIAIGVAGEGLSFGASTVAVVAGYSLVGVGYCESVMGGMEMINAASDNHGEFGDYPDLFQTGIEVAFEDAYRNDPTLCRDIGRGLFYGFSLATSGFNPFGSLGTWLAYLDAPGLIEDNYEYWKRVFGIFVGASLDPEDKFGPIGFDFAATPLSERQHWLPEIRDYDYHVDFWNAENATAPVCDVLAYDQLDPNLNWSTFGFNEVGFMNWTVPLDGAPSFDVYVDTRPSMPYYVHITGGLNYETGNVTLEYHTLDATTLEQPEDPLAGFLPAITSSGSELGWFDYTVSPKADLPTGTRIENQAWVNFDYSTYMPAPPDGPWVNTIDTGAPASQVTSATVVNKTELHIAWTGSDDAGGVGVYDYTVFASVDGGEYLPIFETATGSSAVVSALPGHTYRLYTVAMDYVGHVEEAPSSPDQTITVPETVIADFTATPTNGSAPMTVYFADISTGTANQWSWSFGDGATSNLQSPSHIYQQPGTYDVSLTASGPGGATDSIEREAYVVVSGWAPDTQTPTPTPILGLVAVPGGAGLPTDTNADGKYDDVNGNGRADFADVVLYFNQMSWIAANEPVSAFDYNGNGRIDFADVVWLFNNL